MGTVPACRVACSTRRIRCEMSDRSRISNVKESVGPAYSTQDDRRTGYRWSNLATKCQRSRQPGHRTTHPEQSRVRLVLPRRVIANILCKRFHGDLHPTEHELRAPTLYVTLTVSTSECSGVEHIARMGYNSFCGTGPFPYPAKNPVICVNSGWMQGSIDLPKDDKL
jgi:hypothetical protein